MKKTLIFVGLLAVNLMAQDPYPITLLTPAQGLEVSLNPGVQIPITFSWDKISSVSYYILQIYQGSARSICIYTDTIRNTDSASVTIKFSYLTPHDSMSWTDSSKFIVDSNSYSWDVMGSNLDLNNCISSNCIDYASEGRKFNIVKMAPSYIDSASYINQLRFVNMATGQPVTGININTDQEITVKLQGVISSDITHTWTDVAGSWFMTQDSTYINDNDTVALRYWKLIPLIVVSNPLPSTETGLWTFSPMLAGSEFLNASTGSGATFRSITIKITVASKSGIKYKLTQRILKLPLLVSHQCYDVMGRQINKSYLLDKIGIIKVFSR